MKRGIHQSCPRGPRYPGPGGRRPDRLRRAGGGQDLRSCFGNDTEHEQSGGLALQQSQEAHIRSVSDSNQSHRLTLSLSHALCFFFFN